MGFPKVTLKQSSSNPRCRLPLLLSIHVKGYLYYYVYSCQRLPVLLYLYMSKVTCTTISIHVKGKFIQTTV